MLEAQRVLDGDRHMTAETLKEPQLVGTESVFLAVRNREDADQIPVDVQRNRDLRESVFLACEVIRILANIRGVTHLACRRDISDQPFLPDLQPVALFMNGAAPLACQHQFAALRIVQVDIDLDAAERTGDVVHDLVDQFVEVEDGVDLLGSLLKFEKVLEVGLGEDRHTIRDDSDHF